MVDASNSLFGIHSTALELQQARLNLLATNIANADTPHYHAQDIDFSQTFDAISNKDSLTATHPLHITHADSGNGSMRHVYRIPQQPSLDGNTVDAEYEQAAFARAALHYRTSLSFVDARAKTLLTAITG